jgi:hypothetical protein
MALITAIGWATVCQRQGVAIPKSLPRPLADPIATPALVGERVPAKVVYREHSCLKFDSMQWGLI